MFVHSHASILISLSLSLHLSLPLSPYPTSLIFASLSHGLSLPPSLTLVLSHSIPLTLSLYTHTPKTLLPKTQAWSIEGHVIGCTSSGTAGTIVSQPPILFISLTIDSTDRHLKDAPSAVLSGVTCFGLVLCAGSECISYLEPGGYANIGSDKKWHTSYLHMYQSSHPVHPYSYT